MTLPAQPTPTNNKNAAKPAPPGPADKQVVPSVTSNVISPVAPNGATNLVGGAFSASTSAITPTTVMAPITPITEKALPQLVGPAPNGVSKSGSNAPMPRDAGIPLDVIKAPAPPPQAVLPSPCPAPNSSALPSTAPARPAQPPLALPSSNAPASQTAQTNGNPRPTTGAQTSIPLAGAPLPPLSIKKDSPQVPSPPMHASKPAPRSLHAPFNPDEPPLTQEEVDRLEKLLESPSSPSYSPNYSPNPSDDESEVVEDTGLEILANCSIKSEMGDDEENDEVINLCPPSPQKRTDKPLNRRQTKRGGRKSKRVMSPTPNSNVSSSASERSDSDEKMVSEDDEDREDAAIAASAPAPRMTGTWEDAKFLNTRPTGSSEASASRRSTSGGSCAPPYRKIHESSSDDGASPAAKSLRSSDEIDASSNKNKHKATSSKRKRPRTPPTPGYNSSDDEAPRKGLPSDWTTPLISAKFSPDCFNTIDTTAERAAEKKRAKRDLSPIAPSGSLHDEEALESMVDEEEQGWCLILAKTPEKDKNFYFQYCIKHGVPPPKSVKYIKPTNETHLIFGDEHVYNKARKLKWPVGKIYCPENYDPRANHDRYYRVPYTADNLKGVEFAPQRVATYLESKGVLIKAVTDSKGNDVGLIYLQRDVDSVNLYLLADANGVIIIPPYVTRGAPLAITVLFTLFATNDDCIGKMYVKDVAPGSNCLKVCARARLEARRRGYNDQDVLFFAGVRYKNSTVMGKYGFLFVRGLDLVRALDGVTIRTKEGTLKICKAAPSNRN